MITVNSRTLDRLDLDSIRTGNFKSLFKEASISKEIDLESLEFKDPEMLGDGVSWYVLNDESVLVSLPDSADPEDETTIEEYFKGKFKDVEVDREAWTDACVDTGNWTPSLSKVAAAKVIKRDRTHVEKYEECPHCHEEIREKGSYWPKDEDGNYKYADGRMVMVHRACGKEYISDPDPIDTTNLTDFGRELLKYTDHGH